MGKKLAIKGHPTRGKEVIELLEMMGGENSLIISGYKLSGYEPFNLYYINDNGVIKYKYHSLNKDMVLFTLEDFLEKFPYKVGDKVHIYVQTDDIDGRYDIDAAEITAMRWNPTIRKIAYKMKNINREFYKEEIKCKADDSNKPPKMKNVLAELLEHIKTTPKEELEKEVKEIEEWSNVGPTIEEFMAFCECVNKKPVYPTTYDDCYDEGNTELHFIYVDKYERDLYESFIQLIRCRNAYWKIAGEEMGLGKPWEPDWKNEEQKKYCIYYSGGDIQKGTWCQHNSILAFPTEEMRDAFYENFNDLIESCKELL